MNNNNITQENGTYSLQVSPEQAGLRIDIFLTLQLPIFSRSLIKKLLVNKQIIINHSNPAKPSYIIKYNDTITLLSLPTPTERLRKQIPDDIGVKIIAQEQDFLIINKPAGVVVHPPEQTFTDIALTDWLVEKYPHIADVGDPARPGIVHRLDRNTSGIMIIALTNTAYQNFTTMFKDRQIKKTYKAIVTGHPDQAGSINYFIGRHPIQKNIMHCFTSMPENSTARDATTDYKVLQYFESYSLVEVKPKTGRTHQIRVHFKAIGHPLLGDTVYGTASKKIEYHALHAEQLEFMYQGASYQFSSPLDPALEKIIRSAKLI
jgi:23S rRNA pseudouridine1911/1915/1917 synthase